MKLSLFIFLFSVLLSSGFPSCEKDNDEDEPNSGTVTDNEVNPAKAKPYAYFPFNGNYDDMSGNDHYGYGNPDPKFVTGMTASTKALSFSKATKSAFVVGNGLIHTKSMTVCFWAKDISEGNIFHVTTSSGNKMMMLAYVDGHLRYIITSGNINYTQYGNFTHRTIEDGQWHHIAITSSYGKTGYNEASTILYIDGKIMDTISEKFSFPDDYYKAGTKFILGGEGTPTMQIAHLRVYQDCELDTKRIKNLYDSKN